MADSDITIVGLTSTGGANQIVLQWAVDDPYISAQDYFRFNNAQVFAADNVAMTGATRIDGDNAYTAFADLPLARGVTRYYQVCAVDRSGRTGELCAVVGATETSTEIVADAVSAAVAEAVPAAVAEAVPAAVAEAFALAAAGGGSQGYFEIPSGPVFEWGFTTTDSDGAASAVVQRMSVVYHAFGIPQVDPLNSPLFDLYAVHYMGIGINTPSPGTNLLFAMTYLPDSAGAALTPNKATSINMNWFAIGSAS